MSEVLPIATHGADALLTVRGLTVAYPVRVRLRDQLRRRYPEDTVAVRGLDLTVRRNETVGLVGESGSGKSTTGRAIIRLVQPKAGTVTFDGIDIRAASTQALRRLRERIQIVFQDPYSSLNPRITVGGTIEEVLMVHRIGANAAERRDHTAMLLADVGLGPEHANRYPHELSGGQRQRVGIARALGVNPELLILDEPVSALDVSVQAQVVNLLTDLQRARRLAYLFIAHDLAVVQHIADHVVVMYLAEAVEEGPVNELFGDPRHPYTRSLLASVPGAHTAWKKPQGEIGHLRATGIGCSFRSRCPERHDRCETAPPYFGLAATRRTRCWLDADRAVAGPSSTPSI